MALEQTGTPAMSTPIEPFEWIEVDSLRIRARRTADTGKPKLLLTNAWPQTIRCWDQQWSDLAKSFTLLAIDLPGFGISDGRADLMRPFGQAAVLARLLEQENFTSCVYVAPDIGVPVALALALESPGTLAGMVLFDGPAEYPPTVSWEGKLLYESAVARFVASFIGLPFTLETLRRGYFHHRPSWEAIRKIIGDRPRLTANAQINRGLSPIVYSRT